MRLDRCRNDIECMAQRRKISLPHPGSNVPDHDSLSYPGFEAQIDQGIFQPVLITPHRDINGHPLGRMAGLLDRSGQDRRGLTENIRVQIRHQVDSGAAFRDRDITFHSFVLTIDEAFAVAGRCSHLLHQTRHNIAIEQLNAVARRPRFLHLTPPGQPASGGFHRAGAARFPAGHRSRTRRHAWSRTAPGAHLPRR